MICIASIPRCGSTYLFRSLAGLEQGGSTPEPHTDYGLVKTHRPPSEEDRLDGCDCAIFLFGDVPSAVVSTQRYRHDAKHFANCGRPYREDVDLRDVDYLDYTGITEAWMNSPLDTLAVRYEALSNGRVRAAVQWWASREIAWLPWRERRTKPTRGDRRRVEEAYAPLVAWVQRQPDVQWV